MPEWIAAIILGMVEGVTEFLPVSSTGHLLIVEKFLPHSDFLSSDLFNVVIQSGAVLAVLLNFSQRIKTFATQWRQPEMKDYLLKLGVAFGITGVGGVLLKQLGFELPETVGPVAWATLVGGLLFLAAEYGLNHSCPHEDITWSIAIIAGMAQLLAAVFPGASRSGATILMMLVLGLSRPRAVEFSFLLGVPTLLAAGGLMLFKSLADPPVGAPSINWTLLAIGTVVSAATAFVSVKWLLRFVENHTFVAFGWYRIALGAGLLVFL
ncbi:MAG: undecaprenyl-diphosphate phosphatase [Verrucomicrobiota bacterium]